MWGISYFKGLTLSELTNSKDPIDAIYRKATALNRLMEFCEESGGYVQQDNQLLTIVINAEDEANMNSLHIIENEFGLVSISN